MSIAVQARAPSLRARLMILSATTILASSAAVPAFAQTGAPSPVRQSIDDNGVDLFSGTMNVDAPALTIGAGTQALSFTLVNRGAGWSDNLTATLHASGGVMTVTIGGEADRFAISGTTYTATEGNGATLTFDGSTNIYTYTQTDGTIFRFDRNKRTSTGYPNEGKVVDVTQTSGRKQIYTYTQGMYCRSAVGGPEERRCTQYGAIYRIASVRNSFGYALTPTYESDTIEDTQFAAGSWALMTGVIASNKAADAGAPTMSQGIDGQSTVGALIVTDPLGRSTRYRYGTGGIGGITKPGSSSEDITIAYAGPRVSSVATPSGTTTYVASDAGGVRGVTVTNALSQATVYGFNIASQRMTSRTDPLGRTTSWQYDASGRVTRTTLPEGNYTQLTYDARGNVTESRTVSKTPGTPADIVTSAVYPATCASAAICNKPSSTTDARGAVTDYTYDPTHGGVLSVTARAATAGAVRPQTRYGYATLQAYFSNGNAIVASGEPVTLPSMFSSCVTQASCTGQADETVATISYGPQSAGVGNNLLPVSATTGAGNGTLTSTTKAGYDALGNVVFVDGPLAGTDDTTVLRYNAARQQVGVVDADPDGAGPLPRTARRIVYDVAGRPYLDQAGTVADASDAAWSGFNEAYRQYWSYDPNGRVNRSTIYSAGTDYTVVDYLYDAVGRSSCSIQYMNPAVWGPQASSCTPLQVNGPYGPDRVSRTTYDAAGQVIKTTSGVGTAAQSDDALVTYTANGQTATLTDAENNRTTYDYDGFDRLATTNYPSATTSAGTSSSNDYEQSNYDANGNLLSRRKRDGRTIAYAYDANNRVTAKTYPQGGARAVYYSYDARGLQTSARFDGPGGAEAVSNSYDALGQVQSSTTTMGGVARTLAYQYDANGDRTRITHGNGTSFTYAYDRLGRFNQFYQNGIVGTGAGTIGYDAQGRMATLYMPNISMGSGYDAVSRLNLQQYYFAGSQTGVTQTFGYNPAGQVVAATRDNDAFAFTGHYNVQRSYAANGLNQYTGAGPATFMYDANGNLTGDGLRSYGYDVENRLISASGGVGLDYDPLGRLWRVSAPSGTTTFQHDGDALVAEYAATGQRTKLYFNAPGQDRPLLWYEGSATGSADLRSMVRDRLGSIIAVANANGVPLAINTYDEYGIPGSSNAGRFQYTGQAWLPELGMYYYKARMYSPTLGRFMQTDPIGYADGMSWYGYVGGDPVNFTDPTGLRACKSGEQLVKTGGHNSGSIEETIVNIHGYCAKMPEVDGGDYGGDRSKSGGMVRPQRVAPRNGYRCSPAAVRFGKNLKEAAKSANNYGKAIGLTAGVAALVPGGQVAAPELGALSAISFAVGGVLDIVGSTIVAVETGNYRGYAYDATSAVFGQITGTGHAGADAAANGVIDTMSNAAQDANGVNPTCPR